VIVCLEQGADCMWSNWYPAYGPTAIPKPRHLLPDLNHTGFTFLVPAYPGCPGKEAVKQV